VPATAHARPVPAAGRRRLWRVAPVAVIVSLAAVLTLRPAPVAQARPLAPDFSLPMAAGGHGVLTLHDLRGHPVLLNFFNTQCPPCIAEMPTLRHTARAYHGDGVTVLGVATGGDTVATARRFAATYHLSYPVVADAHQDIAWRYNVGGWPTSLFLDARGRLRGQYVGPLDDQTVRDGLAQAGAIRCARCAAVEPPSLAGVAPAASGSTLSADAVLTPAHPASPFALRDQDGRTVSLGRLRGKVVALTFVSAVCTEQCPLVGQTLDQVRRDLGSAASHLAVVAISVAPERDSAAAIRHFAGTAGWRDMEWHYLSAARRALAPIWAAYGVYVGPPPRPGQDPEHYAGLYLIDPQGRLRAYDDAPFLAPRVAASVRALLASPS